MTGYDRGFQVLTEAVLLCTLHTVAAVGCRRGVVVSGVRRMNEVNARRAG